MWQHLSFQPNERAIEKHSISIYHGQLTTPERDPTDAEGVKDIRIDETPGPLLLKWIIFNYSMDK